MEHPHRPGKRGRRPEGHQRRGGKLRRYIGDGMRGVIGVVGPTRMDYAKITARLSYLAQGLSKLFGQGELPIGENNDGKK